MRRARGFTLVELLITAAILAVVLITAGTFLIQSQRSQQATVDLGSRVDAQAFVSSLLNYDFRIVCYSENNQEANACNVTVGGDKLAPRETASIRIQYFEDRFGESYQKNIAWAQRGDSLVREESIPGDSSSLSNISVVLKNIESFDVKYDEVHSPQLLEFIIKLIGDDTPMHINVAILNEIKTGGS